MSKKSGFAPDDRSDFGRRMIAANMRNHIQRVQNSKSEIDSRLVKGFVSPFFCPVNNSSAVKIGPKKKALLDEYAEVREVARRTNIARHEVDDSLPSTFYMFDVLRSYLLTYLIFPFSVVFKEGND